MPVDPSIGILVVDDFTTMCRIIESLLKRLGFANTSYVYDGQAALDLLLSQSFALVLADWKMSPMSGLQLLHAVRSNEQVRDLRFILMSADANPDLGASVRRCGANGFLRKPFSANALREAIESAFSAPD
jgi:two-component system chemotaxis response regulator CheY